ncbi:TPA: phage antirepressor KilAC domain-containing protein [Streptococcus suis]|uniref:phage antirepressor KilAC domain-containing protein n=1 Tax=Streptococcus suis TaxID=1307 RepID=UPI00298F5EC5|nr:phage antirepressor KilAC domain-containing protein [Streptococcus suis]MDW8574866.1 antA/AntB antirepressor family protein [Streptococcus suis]MDW8588447.1 antA/AntB antirepressor family protein [Streptococcus suis]MDW8614803.1 antA/AntB antirepressor family protein [Streptococcus suis]MDY7602331.1 antA/AntB antirepressor family protein [Streptococcus suis]HEM5363699.1 phage antirepressor KilAC domain-containing protein [Streptococcus suis]
MNELINVNVNDNQEPVVSGRQLHEALGVNSNYTTWFDRMTEYGFTENEDYVLLSNFGNQTGRGGHNKVDHIIKLDMAKEIAMIQRTDRGKQVRQYFIQIEKDFNSPEKIMARALLLADKKIASLTTQNQQLEQELEVAREQTRYLNVILDSKDPILITQIAQDYGMSAKQFNKTLKELGVQRFVNGQWILYRLYQGKGYIASKTFTYEDRTGAVRTKINTVWTQKGRLFLYELLAKEDILPLIERE